METAKQIYKERIFTDNEAEGTLSDQVFRGTNEINKKQKRCRFYWNKHIVLIKNNKRKN